ncbi:allergen [Seiridium cupressi]
MASSLPEGALGRVADSIKSIVSQPGEADTSSVEGQIPTTKSKTTTSQVDDKTVHKTTEPAVEHETVKSREHEKVDTLVDKEVHQDHYARTVQPVKDKNVLPTEHAYQENQSEREIDHRDGAAKKQAQQEGAKFHDEKEVQGTKYTKEQAPTKENEHVHHHLHETIQPVIERETIQPKVVHTTNRVHEKHNLNDEYHGETTAPAVSLSEFEKGTGAQTRSVTSKSAKSKPVLSGEYQEENRESI